ncbi:hypothetical protein KC332_g5425 [Hortaea werneckii]|nr:hypothetical protein KC358_g5531 [Hortaea werneckii]KAI6845390.1 hypothetical protein KC350_g4479 [Hortaea werneckii]KAI6937273.1 hypothetical protein KC348_g5780 [Hortaea werneckii]KAI6937741.1 hypothetical protein KC341_g5373 [Hortaea werneckii]KAI6973326.1 hypothetical protein KC321_g5741 [Hortaea werneckii]
MTTDPLLHEAVLAGDPPYRYRYDPHVTVAIDDIHNRVEEVPEQPRIYANYLVELSTGRSLTRQMNMIAETALKYPFDDDLAEVVDGAIGHSISTYFTHCGARKYLSKREGDWCNYPSLAHAKDLGILCRALKRRCAAVDPTQWDKPLPGSFVEFGFSSQVKTRLEEHQNHINSNYLMNLLEAISKAKLGSGFGFDRFVLYHIHGLDLVELAEVYWTRCGQGYSKNGGGCSYAAAGGSTDSRHSFTASDYDDFFDYSYSQSFVNENVDTFKAKFAKRVADLEAEAAAIAAGNEKMRKAFSLQQEVEDRVAEEEMILAAADDDEEEQHDAI